jgi:hypothetical protein
LFSSTVATHGKINKMNYYTDSDLNTSVEPPSQLMVIRPERGVDYRFGNEFERYLRIPSGDIHRTAFVTLDQLRKLRI